ncbi:YiiX/YebB-like N1pC/P60 family cysteine hydrolase [Polluticaenibacter yanchengensis]|uniref:YiiX/YebB-like N1pC/P60 family cysteine hydrolase n=1 Tax=Polluticaenibacter yanchengensis TaxID=3014562 RepID=A0ABT4UG37_9BACT|nr:YiiX/YebB-like N1pC/P60 family cysteine hydrolase [Chitinophagaceae bacterium LY-5]
MKLKSIVLLELFILFILSINSSAQKIQYSALKSGDIIFQNLDCGPTCDAIEAVTRSYKNMSFSHIGLIVKQNDSLKVIEAIGSKVQYTDLYQFMSRTKNAHAIARPKTNKKFDLEKALRFANAQVGVPYDDEFIYNNNKYYCSELIYDAFMKGNNNKPFFKLEPMTFKPLGSDTFFEVWTDYYKKLGISIPEGALGINPGGISRSKRIKYLCDNCEVIK